MEDDCIPHHDFFLFTELLIDRYRDDKRIWTISGNNFQSGIWRGDGSYYLSRFPHCWGWATWRRSWAMYDRDISDWPNIKSKALLKNQFR